MRTGALRATVTTRGGYHHHVHVEIHMCVFLFTLLCVLRHTLQSFHVVTTLVHMIWWLHTCHIRLREHWMIVDPWDKSSKLNEVFAQKNSTRFDLFKNWTSLRAVSLFSSCPLLWGNRPIFSGSIVGSVQNQNSPQQLRKHCSYAAW